MPTDNESEQIRTGGCLCGRIRYRVVGAPIATRICWCRDCQHIAGNGTANAIFSSGALTIEGDAKEFQSTADSGNQVTRRFCGHCGCHLFADNTGRSGFTVVRVGTLDDPSSVTPTSNIWTASAPAWSCRDASLTDSPGQPTQLRASSS